MEKEKKMSDKYSPENIEETWTKVAQEQLLGKTIVAVRYMSREEADEIGWDTVPVVMQLDDGNLVYPGRDAEGNDSGVLFTNNEKEPVLPAL